ncbi:MAG: DUF547 domain-containing protein [Fidelibacterota bacterium]
MMRCAAVPGSPFLDVMASQEEERKGRGFPVVGLIVLTFVMILALVMGIGMKSPVNSHDITPVSKEHRVEAYDCFNSVLGTFVDSTGRVDYVSLRKNPLEFNQFLEFIRKVSPENEPELFKTDGDTKAYWMNVYNALVMKAVTEHPGISSVNDLGWAKGVFWRKKFEVGGSWMTLHQIENGILRKRYRDPRIHFAINCGTNSCPPLGNRILSGHDLDAQLEAKTAQFIRDEANVRIDHDGKEVWLSRIFKWYQRDFTVRGKTLLEYVVDYLPGLPEDEKVRILSEYSVKFNNYDWGLNGNNSQ